MNLPNVLHQYSETAVMALLGCSVGQFAYKTGDLKSELIQQVNPKSKSKRWGLRDICSLELGT